MHAATASSIIARRKAAYVLNEICREAELGTLAEKFNSDNPDEWAVVDDRELRAIKHGRVVAEVVLETSQALVSIEKPEGLVRMKHWSDFDPAAHGFGPQKYNWMKEPLPYRITVQIPDDLQGLNAPMRRVPRQPSARKFNVKRSL